MASTPQTAKTDRRVRLTADQVLVIRRLHATGERSMPQLAREYGVHRGTIQDILERQTWKHLAAVAWPLVTRTPRGPAARVLRVLFVLRQLNAGSPTVSELAVQLAVKRRAIEEDLALLRSLGVGVRQANGRYRADRQSVQVALGLVAAAPFTLRER